MTKKGSKGMDRDLEGFLIANVFFLHFWEIKEILVVMMLGIRNS